MEASNVTLEILYQRLKIGILHVCEVPGSGVLNTMSIKLPNCRRNAVFNSSNFLACSRVLFRKFKIRLENIHYLSRSSNI